MIVGTKKYLEKIFRKFNSRENPLSTRDNQEKIKSLETHTSMSVGDVIQINDKYYSVSGEGFHQVR